MEEESGLTLGEIFKVVLKKIWWVIGATALALIIVVLVTQLWYNKTKQTYSLKYDIIYPYSDNGKYPDGSDFLTADIISLSTLTAVKSSNESFSDIDVKKMVARDDITISGSTSRDDSGSFVRTLRLKVYAKYFRSEKQAADFMQAISDYPIDRVNELIESKIYGVHFPAYDGAGTYEEKISALLAQKNYIVNSYNTLIGYGGVVEVNLASLSNIFTSQDRDALNKEIKNKLYVFDTQKFIEEYQTSKAALEKQIEDNGKIIEALKAERNSFYGSGSSSAEGEYYNPYDVKIAEYTEKNVKLQIEIDDLEATKAAIESYLKEDSDEYKEKAEFDAKLEKYRAQIEEATATLKEVSKDIYLNNSRVVYSGNKIEVSGGIGVISGALFGMIAGLVVSVAVVLIIDLPKYKRAKLALQAAAAEGKSGDDGENKK